MEYQLVMVSRSTSFLDLPILILNHLIAEGTNEPAYRVALILGTLECPLC